MIRLSPGSECVCAGPGQTRIRAPTPGPGTASVEELFRVSAAASSQVWLK